MTINLIRKMYVRVIPRQKLVGVKKWTICILLIRLLLAPKTRRKKMI